ncbi:hypothetical protein PCE1_001866 [Barthelona sp. PCE]
MPVEIFKGKYPGIRFRGEHWVENPPQLIKDPHIALLKKCLYETNMYAAHNIEDQKIMYYKYINGEFELTHSRPFDVKRLAEELFASKTIRLTQQDMERTDKHETIQDIIYLSDQCIMFHYLNHNGTPYLFELDGESEIEPLWNMCVCNVSGNHYIIIAFNVSTSKVSYYNLYERCYTEIDIIMPETCELMGLYEGVPCSFQLVWFNEKMLMISIDEVEKRFDIIEKRFDHFVFQSNSCFVEKGQLYYLCSDELVCFRMLDITEDYLTFEPFIDMKWFALDINGPVAVAKRDGQSFMISFRTRR